MKKLFIKILFTISLFHSSLFTQWVQQTLPVSGIMYDIEFVNTNTGFISLNTPALMKTTNGGQNWIVLNNFEILHLYVVDTVTIYGVGYRGAYVMLYRSFDLGITWDSVSRTSSWTYNSTFFPNRDTGIVSGLIASNTIFRTTDGGVTLTPVFTGVGAGRLFFLKEKVNNEYYGWNLSGGSVSRTTNSGLNWSAPVNTVNGIGGNYNWLFYLNKDTGWVSFDMGQFKIFRTNNSGLNWIEQFSSSASAGEIFFINERKGWAGYGPFKVLATTNGGLNWGTQTTPIFANNFIEFVDTNNGWTCASSLARTTNGGGIITYIGIQQISGEIPSAYKLEQNYPNPFNPITNIKYQIPNNKSNVKITVYDIAGKEIIKLVDQEHNAGTYSVDWNAGDLPSGVYFYKLITESFTETKKAILIK